MGHNNQGELELYYTNGQVVKIMDLNTLMKPKTLRLKIRRTYEKFMCMWVSIYKRFYLY